MKKTLPVIASPTPLFPKKWCGTKQSSHCDCHSGLDPESRQKLRRELRRDWRNVVKFKLSINDWALLSLPIAVWFSYHPLLEFGRSETMYFEISLTLLALLIFGITALPHLWRARREIINKKLAWLVIAFTLWNWLSVIWSANTLRGLLTAGVVGLLAITFLRIITHPRIKQLLPVLFLLFTATALLVSLFAWLQMLLDIAGVPMANTLICLGCQYEYFGFPRAVGFAIEPQFLGSLLLAPVLMTLFATYKKKMSAWYYAPTIFLLITLFMTLSRGAIYALAVGLLVLFIINIRKVKQNLLTVGLVVVSFVISLAAQGSMVAFNPAVNETFTAGIAKSIHHLSLGTLDFRQEAKQVDANFVLTDETPTTKSDDIYFDGYVAESTQARLSFNELAFDAWKSSPTTLLFGAGLGSAGIAMNQTHPDQIGRLEITQNEYTEIPLELGLVGALLFVALLVAFFHRTADRKWTWVIIVAYLTQWIFFSGYPNAVHIYLVLFFLLVSPNLELKNYQNAKR